MVHVYFYVPNIIGYARVILFIVGVFIIAQEGERYAKDPSLRDTSSTDLASIVKSKWMLGLIMYVASFVLDFFDGFFARMFSQSSNFGAVLDMVTDRCATAYLLVVLGASLYRDYLHVFAGLMILDISSHWYQMQAAAKGHHKEVGSDKNIIVRTFYQVYPFFAYLCAGTEFFYIFLVIVRFLPAAFHPVPAIPLTVWQFAQFTLLPACVAKNIVNVAQLASAAASIAKGDLEKKAEASKSASKGSPKKKN